MTRGRRGSLLLRREALSSSPSCRFIPAHYLFGSRADGTARPASDLDLGVLPLAPIPTDTLARLREAFEESTIPWEVDLVDLSRVDPEFRDRVVKQGQLWIG